MLTSVSKAECDSGCDLWPADVAVIFISEVLEKKCTVEGWRKFYLLVNRKELQNLESAAI